jgi:hypothetical protein
VLCSAPT